MLKGRKLYDVGQLLIVLGSVLYVIELLTIETWGFTLAICGVYVVALAVLLIGRTVERIHQKATNDAPRA